VKTITTNQETADRVFETTGFGYDIAETVNADGTVSLEFDSDEDARTFEKVASRPDVTISGTLDFEKTQIEVKAETDKGRRWLEEKLGPATISFKTRKSRVIEIEESLRSAGLAVHHV